MRPTLKKKKSRAKKSLFFKSRAHETNNDNLGYTEHHEMSWDPLIEKYVDALPDHVSFEGIAVKCDDSDISLPLEKFQLLWSKLSSNTLPSNFLVQLSRAVNDLPDAEELSRQLDHLEEMLSPKMNDVQLKVKIPNLLTSLLSKVFSELTKNEADEIATAQSQIVHLVTVELEILSRPENLEKSMREKYIKDLNQLHKKAHNDLECLSAKLKISSISEKVFHDRVTISQALVALAVVAKCYPKKWHRIFFWHAWFAVTLQLCTLPQENRSVFPYLWIQNIFDAEKYSQDPAKVNHLLFGMDPPSSRESKSSFPELATGIAFYAVGDRNPSIKKMDTLYGLDCTGTKPIEHCRKGLLMINMIRCIYEDEKPEANSCRRAWVAYTLKIMHYFCSLSKPKPIFVLTMTPSTMTEYYIPKVCKSGYLQGPHPLNLKPEHNEKANPIKDILKIYCK